MKSRDLIYNFALLFLLNPFVGSGFTSFLETDLNALAIITPSIVFLFTRNIVGLLCLILFFFFEFSYVYYLQIFILLIELKNYKPNKKILEFTVYIWFLLFLFQLFIPDLLNILFFRDLSLIVGRGYSSFGPEPATSGLFALCFFFAFDLNKYIKFLILILIIATFNIWIFIAFIILFVIKNIDKPFKILLLSTLSVLLIIYNFKYIVQILPLRFVQFYQYLSQSDFLSIFEDTSLNNRFQGLSVFIYSILSLEFGINNYLISDYLVANNKIFRREISSGILVPFNSYGFLFFPFLFYLIKKSILRIDKFIILILFFFTGSFAHIFPLYFLIYDNFSFNTTLQRQKNS